MPGIDISNEAAAVETFLGRITAVTIRHPGQAQGGRYDPQWTVERRYRFAMREASCTPREHTQTHYQATARDMNLSSPVSQGGVYGIIGPDRRHNRHRLFTVISK